MCPRPVAVEPRDQPFAQLFALHELVAELAIISARDLALEVGDAVAQQPLQRRRLFRCEIHLNNGPPIQLSRRMNGWISPQHLDGGPPSSHMSRAVESAGSFPQSKRGNIRAMPEFEDEEYEF